ncbi:TBC1 domain family member 16-like isoform X2 [Gigantopelta aegis]|uniref:TBC1 domain family member 16-like isoform X2 n=1 Tax=Gigantopelta aegis TaxID=1735272 RepID=UPI001B888FEF|nr:TBC1 domain family member 16-like isoform X2 [Gigantopelta aegis]
MSVCIPRPLCPSRLNITQDTSLSEHTKIRKPANVTVGYDMKVSRSSTSKRHNAPRETCKVFAAGPTLVLTWIPNLSLKKNPRSIENSPNCSKGNTPRPSPKRTPKQEYSKSNEPTPSPSESPGDSSVMGELGFINGGDKMITHKKKHSTDNTSLSSELSAGSREEDTSIGSWNPGEEVHHDGHRLSSSNKSAADSGIGSDEIVSLYIQNNEKTMHGGAKRSVIGIHVNDLTVDKTSKSNTEHHHQYAGREDSGVVPNTDGLTSEEQLVAMLNRNKLHMRARERTDSNKSVSIEMEGERLVVVTEEMDGGPSDRQQLDIVDKNTYTNESKFDTSSSPESGSVSSDSTNPSPSESSGQTIISELREELLRKHDLLFQNEPHSKPYPIPSPCGGSGGLTVPSDLDLGCLTVPPPNTPILTPDISVTRVRNTSSSSTTTSGPDSQPPSPYTSDAESAPSSPSKDAVSPESPSVSSNGSAGFSHNMTFPNNSLSHGSSKKEKKSAKEQLCGVFSVDLGQMRSLRLFYSDQECTQGQVVIASRESQYKILHFHNGGLDKLAQIFEDWSLFAKSKEKQRESDVPYRQFLVIKPQITDDQCHPEEGVFSLVTEEIWKQHLMANGSIEDDFQLRKAIFFGGLDPCLRHEAWPFLLHYYPFSSTFDEQEQIRNDKYIEYQNIRKMRESMTGPEQDKFWRSIQCTVEKDVVRTDRSHPYFCGENNPNIEVLKTILLNYAVANPWMGYTQGMSDLLAPVLAEVQNEVDAYWCFVGLMQRTIFVSSPRDSDMDKQLSYLRELIRLMQPKFFAHLEKLTDDAMELLFCHRWILLCFKREFPEASALRIWETCWAHYQTDYFHLFICVAIVAIYGEDIVEQGLAADEMLLHFSSLALHMNGDIVLRKARGLLHQFRKKRKIPCSLSGLCIHCGSGMWDSGHVPTVYCVGHSDDEVCPHNSQPSSPAAQ